MVRMEFLSSCQTFGCQTYQKGSVETERLGCSGPELGAYGSQSLCWERLGFLVCQK